MESDRDILRLTAHNARLKSSLYWLQKSNGHLNDAAIFYQTILDELASIMREFAIDVPQDRAEFPKVIRQALKDCWEKYKKDAQKHP